MILFSKHIESPDKKHSNQQVINCPALTSLFQGFSDDQKYRILDLGKANGANVTFFSSLRCKLFVGEVMPAILSYQRSLTDDDQPSLMLPNILDLDDLFDLNLVLCWDILNYLDTRLFDHFREFLHRIITNGGSLHAFVYTHKTMPTLPGNYQILDTGQMNVVHSVNSVTPAPRYGQRELEKLLPGFTVKQTRLLQTGVQEYLFNRN